MATPTKTSNSSKASTNGKPQLGLTEKQREGVVSTLCTVLADSHVLYIKLRKFHWNVKGPQFHALHELFEQQYTSMALAIDEIAERIVQYGVSAPGTMKEFIGMARLKENSTDGLSIEADTMVEQIVADHEAVVRSLREDIKTVGEDCEDVGAEDFLTGLLQDHQKFAWMARAMIGKPTR